MKTNELKKGQRVKLRNGWEADIADNMRGTTRMAKVYGYHTEMGSVYAHDIKYYQHTEPYLSEDGPDYQWLPVEHTKAQLKLRETINKLGF